MRHRPKQELKLSQRPISIAPRSENTNILYIHALPSSLLIYSCFFYLATMQISVSLHPLLLFVFPYNSKEYTKMIQFQSLTKTLLFPLILSSLVLYLKAQRESDTTDTVTSIQIDATGAVKNPDSQNHPPKPFQCNLYLAPSSIPGAGFGVFTTRDIKQNELILDYLDSPSVVVTDMASHTQNTENDYWTHIDYFWSGDGPAEFEAEDVSENVFMLGSLSNYHTYLRNVKVSIMIVGSCSVFVFIFCFSSSSFIIYNLLLPTYASDFIFFIIYATVAISSKI